MLERRPRGARKLSEAVWIDLLDPTESERAEVEGVTGLRLPTKEAISEIETSSRVYVEAGALYLSTPMLTGDDCLTDTLTTVGFVLTPSLLVTIRFARITAFESTRDGE